jgi:hypothetical protein
MVWISSGHNEEKAAGFRSSFASPLALVRAIVVIACVGSGLWSRVALADEDDELESMEQSGANDRHPRRFCLERSSCHVLAYTFFVPSTLSPSYVGVRVGGAYQSSSSSPFPTLGGNFQRVIGLGAIELSKELWLDRVSLFGSLIGALGTGTNGSSIIGTDTEAGGGVDIGFVANLLLRKSTRIAFVDRAMRRYGYSVLLERAADAVPIVPNLANLSPLFSSIGPAANKLPVPFIESGNRADIAWLWVATPWLSYQGAIGAEFTHRYYRNDPLSYAPDIHRVVGPRLGTAVEVDLSTQNCLQGCIPLAVVLEHQMSPTRLQLDTLERLRSPPRARFVDQVLALGFHYTSDRHSDFDAGLTGYLHWNVPQPLAMTVNPSPPLATEYGAQVMARYCW